jgi:hypothetical protein
MATVTRRPQNRATNPRNGKPVKSDKLIYLRQDAHRRPRRHEQLLGGKGANLAGRSGCRFRGFTITTQCRDLYYKSGKSRPLP